MTGHLDQVYVKRQDRLCDHLVFCIQKRYQIKISYFLVLDLY